jgi:prophage antirepressor-like protein
MEVIEVAKELFNNENVRILGAKDKPLFVAADIGKLLGMKDNDSTIRNYNNTERHMQLCIHPQD